MTVVFPLKGKISLWRFALNVIHVVVLVYLAFLTGSLPIKNLEKLYSNKFFNLLSFLDDLFLKFAMEIEQKSLDVSLDSEKDYDNK